ncbi:MAG TPA: PTS sucrose transporter subunit IIBC [Ktedonobacteraceae bacterium]|nr:PTS sucrose transporter subunit IIBC [Ktedonobacteraceae bacterium]
MISTIASAAFLNMSDPQAAGILIGDIFGLVLALPVSLFLAFWMSAVKSKWAVILGALLGAIIGFLIILGWIGTLINDKPMSGASGAPVFFGSVLFCAAMGLIGGILMDLLVGATNKKDYGRQVAHETH